MPSPTLPDDKGDKGLAPPFGTALSPFGSSRKSVSPASPLQSTGAWEPIETAPKDGEEILLFELLPGNEPMMRVGYWEERGEPLGDVGTAAGWSLADSGYIGEIGPTHWQPLPAPPEQGK